MVKDETISYTAVTTRCRNHNISMVLRFVFIQINLPKWEEMLNIIVRIAIIFFYFLCTIESWAFIPRIPTSLRKNAGDQYVHQFIKPGDRIVGGRPGSFSAHTGFILITEFSVCLLANFIYQHLYIIAVHGEFPYQVSIQKVSFFGTKTHYCGGAVVGQCVVTAV